MTEKKFSQEEIHLIVNTLSRNAFSPEKRESISKCLAAKKAKGVKIDDQAIAICIKENESKNNTDDYFHTISKTYKVVEYK